MDDNPYAPPEADTPDPAERRPALREIVIAWEKLRLAYNAILAAPGLAVLYLSVERAGLPLVASVIYSLLVAACANIAFLLGPAAELYLCGLFRDGRPLGRGRLLLFGAGLLCSAGVFAVALAGM